MTSREWSEKEKTKSAAVAYIRRAKGEGLPDGASIPEEVERLLVQEWPGNSSTLESIRVALGEMVKLGERYECRGGYWKKLMRAASLIGATDLELDLREHFRGALLRLKALSLRGQGSLE